MPAAVAAAEAQRHEPSTTAAPAQSTPSPPAPLQAARRANEAGPPAALNEEEHEAATLATLAAQSAGGGFLFTLFIFKKCQNVQPSEDLVLDGELTMGCIKHELSQRLGIDAEFIQVLCEVPRQNTHSAVVSVFVSHPRHPSLQHPSLQQRFIGQLPVPLFLAPGVKRLCGRNVRCVFHSSNANPVLGDSLPFDHSHVVEGQAASRRGKAAAEQQEEEVAAVQNTLNANWGPEQKCVVDVPRDGAAEEEIMRQNRAFLRRPVTGGGEARKQPGKAATHQQTRMEAFQDTLNTVLGHGKKYVVDLDDDGKRDCQFWSLACCLNDASQKDDPGHTAKNVRESVLKYAAEPSTYQAKAPGGDEGDEMTWAQRVQFLEKATAMLDHGAASDSRNLRGDSEGEMSSDERQYQRRCQAMMRRGKDGEDWTLIAACGRFRVRIHVLHLDGQFETKEPFVPWTERWKEEGVDLEAPTRNLCVAYFPEARGRPGTGHYVPVLPFGEPAPLCRDEQVARQIQEEEDKRREVRSLPILGPLLGHRPSRTFALFLFCSR